MQLLDINYVNFRNLKDSKLSFDKRFNLFLGKNGQGKTSILEAIYFTATGKSFRTKKQEEVLKYGKDNLGTFLNFEDRISEKNLSVRVQQKSKDYLYNRKKVRYDEFFGKLNVISFIPEDIDLIMGAPSIRRSFFDYEISQANYAYYEELRKFSKILKVRNKYLKGGVSDGPVFEIYNREFLASSAKIIARRLDYVKKLSILLNLNYRKLFDPESELAVKYKSFIGDLKKESEAEILEKIEEKYHKVKSRERRYGYSLIGPQRDDFVFLLREKEAKSYSSQGEKKSIIFALKLSEIDMIIRERKETPIFLIDDISSYFDGIRKESIIKYFEKRDIQVFITSTSDLNISSKNFYVDEGEVK